MTTLLFSSGSIEAETLPAGFAERQYAHGLINPTAMAFAPDPCPSSGTPVHRLFVCEQAGRVRVFRNGVLQPNAFLNVIADTRGERGLDGICFDPNFATNHYVYIYYTIRQADDSLPTHNRLIRVTADPSHPDVVLAGSGRPIMEMDDLSAGSFVHNGGGMHFGPDGKLYVSVGENGNGSNAQSFSTVLGKVLRINPVPENADGTNPESTFPADNPFYNSTTGKNRAIYILGVRNPFTFAFQRGIGRLFIDDVGSFIWEEINDGVRGGNYGWPTTEGPAEPPPVGLINPIFAYMHFSGTPRGCAITGGDFYNPAPLCSGDPLYHFPNSYEGQYFFLDFCGNFIYTMDPNQIDPASQYGFHRTALFASDIHGSPIYLIVGPDANLYYISRDDGAVYQIHYPASLSPTIGTQPTDQLVGQGWPATFSVAASGVLPLHYQWQRGTANISGAPDSPTYTLLNPQVATDNQATFRCVVSNAYGSATSVSALLTVIPQQPPTPTISAPGPNAYYAAGDVISFAGSATDPQDGTLPPSALTWTILFEHHALTNPNHHTHPFFPPTSGITHGTVTIPTSGETDPDVWYRIFLTAVDSFGLSQTTFRDIAPRLSQLRVTSDPQLFQVTLDGSPKNPPYPFWSVVHLRRTIGAETPQTVSSLTYDFYSWSDGGARVHDIITPATPVAYIANFWKRPGYGSITANPNPIQMGEVATVFWSSGQTRLVEVHRDSPSGPLFATSVAGSFSHPTGTWVQEGTKLFLQDVTNRQPLTPAYTLDSVTFHVSVGEFSRPPFATGSITADPNPLSTDPGVTTLAWTSHGATNVEIHVNAPNGNRFAGSGPGSFTARTPQWARAGMTFYLQNVSNGLPLTAANTIAKVTLVGGTISLNPNPIHVTDGSGLGITTVNWNSYGTSAVEVHVDSPSGTPFAFWGTGMGSQTTGQWVQNGQKFFLQDVSDGKPLTSANTLAVATAVVVQP